MSKIIKGIRYDYYNKRFVRGVHRHINFLYVTQWEWNILDNSQKIKIKQATRKGYEEMINNGVADLAYPSSNTRRGRVQGGVR